jgi:hypothetical protein
MGRCCDERSSSHNSFEQMPEGGNVPFPFAEFVDQPPQRRLRNDVKARVKGSACGNHSKVLIEYQERFADGFTIAYAKAPFTSISESRYIIPHILTHSAVLTAWIGCIHPIRGSAGDLTQIA